MRFCIKSKVHMAGNDIFVLNSFFKPFAYFNLVILYVLFKLFIIIVHKNLYIRYSYIGYFFCNLYLTKSQVSLNCLLCHAYVMPFSPSKIIAEPSTRLNKTTMLYFKPNYSLHNIQF